MSFNSRDDQLQQNKAKKKVLNLVFQFRNGRIENKYKHRKPNTHSQHRESIKKKEEEKISAKMKSSGDEFLAT